MEGRVLQRRGEDEEGNQLDLGDDGRPARPAAKPAAPGALRVPAAVPRRPPPREAAAARRGAVAGGPRRHRVVLHGLHDLRLPAWPRVLNESLRNQLLLDPNKA